MQRQAKLCLQYYINHRWLGGTLTNWKTISNSIRRLGALEDMLAQTEIKLTKKETLRLTRERDKLDRALGGIKNMGGVPDMMFVIDTNKESIAIQEANKLGIPVVAIVDSKTATRTVSRTRSRVTTTPDVQSHCIAISCLAPYLMVSRARKVTPVLISVPPLTRLPRFFPSRHRQKLQL